MIAPLSSYISNYIGIDQIWQEHYVKTDRLYLFSVANGSGAVMPIPDWK
jgi:hypothetical protein